MPRTRRPVVAPIPCVPVGELVRPDREPGRCSCGTFYVCADPACDVRLVRVPDAGKDPARQEWLWDTADGSPLYVDRTPEPLRPYLADAAGMARLGREDILTYSWITNLWSMGGSLHHRHEPATMLCGYPSEAHPVHAFPECCGWPMLARPQGWSCRRTHAFFPYQAVPVAEVA